VSGNAVSPTAKFVLNGSFSGLGGKFIVYSNNVLQNILELDDDNAIGVRVGFFGVTPHLQADTSIATIARTAVAGGNAVDDNDTFGGYTIGQIVTALKAYGLLA
jgi:hypothetical protein